jgi:hypothetical protein
MKIKTNELIDNTLDWAVAKCEGLLLPDGGNLQIFNKQLRAHPAKLGTLYTPSTDWAQGGPIIEREWLDITPWPNESDEELQWQCKQHDSIDCVAFGPTPLIAAMRCYVASKLGDEVEIPEELCQPTA